jgi:hypothetical protein
VILALEKPISLGEIRTKKKAGARKKEVRGQRSEVRKQRSEVREQKLAVEQNSAFRNLCFQRLYF